MLFFYIGFSFHSLRCDHIVTLVGVNVLLQFERKDALNVHRRLSQGRGIVLKAASGGLLYFCRDGEMRYGSEKLK